MRLPGERLRLRFLSRGLADPGTARRLGQRAAPVAVALAGLDPARRRRVGDLLRDRVAEDTPAEMRRTCALLGVALCLEDEQLGAAAVRLLADAGPEEQIRQQVDRLRQKAGSAVS